MLVRLRPIVAAAAVVAMAAPALAQSSFVNQHVRVEYNSGRKVVGQVIDESDETITLRLGKGSSSTIDRADIKEMVSIEKTVQEIKKKEKEAKSGEDWYQVALLYEKEGFHPSFIRECVHKAIKVDPNHEKARKKAGFEKRTNERGESVWLDKKTAKSYDAISGSVKKTAEAMGERPWDEHKIVVRRPEKAPEYEIITNCPDEVAVEYANFMVELKTRLVDLINPIAKLVGKKIEWQKFPCTECKGSGGSCGRCGGKGQEPAKVFIANSHKFFMDITGSPEGLGGYYRPGYFPPGECDRPIVTFHGQFGTGNTFMVLAHEGTHQLEHLMWKGDHTSLFYRPGFLTEGLAVFFGDGLVMKRGAKGERVFEVGIPRDRLAALRRQLKQGKGKYYPIKRFVSYGIPQYQQDPGLYAYGWSLIYFMLNSKDKFKFDGKDIDLRESFGRFFMDNCEKGALEEFGPQAGYVGLARALGIDRKDADRCMDELETVWRDFILDNKKVPLTAVGDWDKTDKNKFVSKDLGFEFSRPGGKGKPKPKFQWDSVPPEELVSTLLEEAAALTDKGGQARAIVAVHANAENLDIDDSLDLIRERTKQRRFEASSYKELGEPAEGALALSGVETRIIDFEGKERKWPGYVDNPRPNMQKGKMLVCRTAKLIYQVIVMTDQDAWGNFEPDLKQILDSFAINAG